MNQLLRYLQIIHHDENFVFFPFTFKTEILVTSLPLPKVNGKKQSFHHDGLFANTAIVDSFFIEHSSPEVIKNSAIDACAQCTEGFDSKNGNQYTKFLCQKAFDFLEKGILENNKEHIVTGSLLSGLGFGNCSTTLGHAISYVFSNEGINHGHALEFTTTEAHKFNKSIFYQRFLNLVKKLEFQPINIKQDLGSAAEAILTDRKHLDNNPKPVTKTDLVFLLKEINENKIFQE